MDDKAPIFEEAPQQESTTPPLFDDDAIRAGIQNNVDQGKKVKIDKLPPRDYHDITAIPPCFRNDRRWVVSSSSVWKQITDFTVALTQKSKTINKMYIDSFVIPALKQMKLAQDSLTRVYTTKSNLAKQVFHLKHAKAFIIDACNTLKTLHQAGVFNKRSASYILSYGVTVVMSLDRMIAKRIEIISKKKITNKTAE